MRGLANASSGEHSEVVRCLLFVERVLLPIGQILRAPDASPFTVHDGILPNSELRALGSASSRHTASTANVLSTQISLNGSEMNPSASRSTFGGWENSNRDTCICAGARAHALENLLGVSRRICVSVALASSLTAIAKHVRIRVWLKRFAPRTRGLVPLLTRLATPRVCIAIAASVFDRRSPP